MHDIAGLCEQSCHVAVESPKDGGDEGQKIGNGVGGNMFHEKSEVESPPETHQTIPEKENSRPG